MHTFINILQGPTANDHHQQTKQPTNTCLMCSQIRKINALIFTNIRGTTCLSLCFRLCPCPIFHFCINIKTCLKIATSICKIFYCVYSSHFCYELFVQNAENKCIIRRTCNYVRTFHFRKNWSVFVEIWYRGSPKLKFSGEYNFV
jgi:hypothetical protein